MPALSNAFNPGRGGGGLDDFEMVDAQHDGNHRAHIGLVVNNENAGH